MPPSPNAAISSSFKLPRNDSIDYVRRIVGLPGDEISLRGGVLFINGKEVPRRRLADFEMNPDSGTPKAIPAYEETLPNGVKYALLNADANGPLENIGPFKVPAGKYFVMGDNRDHSTDSRALMDVGYVPYESLEGRAELLYSALA